MIRFDKLRARLRQSLDFEVRPNFGFIRSAIERALRGRLAHEDLETKSAVVIGDSLWLAGLLGLKKARLLHLRYPDFTIENLALLSDEYDFVIADRVLHRCDNPTDAGRETMRVLRPGGWFVHTASILDFAPASPVNRRMLGPCGLRALFPYTVGAHAGGWGYPFTAKVPRPPDNPADWAAVSWIVGQKASNAPAITPSLETRVARRPWYRFRPRHAKFAVTAMLRNEAPYLLEWIAYYRVLGFGQITLYDNSSNDASTRIIAPLSQAGIINAVFWPDRNKKQTRAYNHAARRLRPFVEWCLFADLDEFLVLEPGQSLDDLVSKEPDVSAIAIAWRFFGSAGKRNREVGLTIERFIKAAPENSQVAKTLVRLRDLRSMSVHLPRLIDGRVTDVKGRTVENLRATSIPHATSGPPRINHYRSRSWEEFECKRARGFGAAPGQFTAQSTFDRGGAGEVVVTDTLRLAPAVQEEMERLRKIVEGR